MAGVEEVEVVVAHHECATLRVGGVFLKIDADQARTGVEVEAMAMAPVPTPEVLWRKPPVLALAALPGTALGRLGEPSAAPPAAWAAAGAAARMLHDAPLPPWPGQSPGELASHLDGECEWLVANGVLPASLVTRNRRVAEAALRPWAPVFTHGDLQADHVFVAGDVITGVVDWSEAGRGDALYDLASLTLGHEEHLGDVVAGYGTDVDLDLIRAGWSLRSLTNGPLADRARLRPVLARLRGRRAEIPAVRLHKQRALQAHRHAMRSCASCPSGEDHQDLCADYTDRRCMPHRLFRCCRGVNQQFSGAARTWDPGPWTVAYSGNALDQAQLRENDRSGAGSLTTPRHASAPAHEVTGALLLCAKVQGSSFIGSRPSSRIDGGYAYGDQRCHRSKRWRTTRGLCGLCG